MLVQIHRRHLLQAVCCSVLQCVAMCCSVLQSVAVCYSMLQCVAVCYSALRCVVVCCSALQCVNEALDSFCLSKAVLQTVAECVTECVAECVARCCADFVAECVTECDTECIEVYYYHERLRSTQGCRTQRWTRRRNQSRCTVRRTRRTFSC